MNSIKQPITFSSIDRNFADLIVRLSRTPDSDKSIFMAAALASNALQNGHSCTDMKIYAQTEIIINDKPLEIIKCPPVDIWIKTLLSAHIAGIGGITKPLIICGTKLYLFRYWEYEHQLSLEIQRRCLIETPVTDSVSLKNYLDLFFPAVDNFPDWQRCAAALAILKKLCIVSGGPGTGKTTTITKIIVLFLRLSYNKTMRIALAAPTGKAATRLTESIHSITSQLDLSHDTIDKIPREALTLHRLLGTIPHSPFFRYHKNNLLPYDLIIIDEASMVDLALMAKLFNAIHPDTHIILLGDKDQLSSVEAGSVFGDICDCGVNHSFSIDFRKKIAHYIPYMDTEEKNEPAIANCLVTLNKNFRFNATSGINTVSRAIKTGNFNNVCEALKNQKTNECIWWTPPSYEAMIDRLAQFSKDHFEPILSIKDPLQAFQLFNHSRIICALRNGPYGVNAINSVIEKNISLKLFMNTAKIFQGKPIIVTSNNYHLELFNGDIGIVMKNFDNPLHFSVFFQKSGKEIKTIPLERLPSWEPAFALTAHKSQGSEFNKVIVILPAIESPVLSRELLYTAITRAKHNVEIWSISKILQLTVESKIQRFSGLRDALWG